jgi:hypothetical protein
VLFDPDDPVFLARCLTGANDFPSKNIPAFFGKEKSAVLTDPSGWCLQMHPRFGYFQCYRDETKASFNIEYFLIRCVNRQMGDQFYAPVHSILTRADLDFYVDKTILPGFWFASSS